MKRKPLSRTGKSEVAKCKVRIQKLLREICILRDGGCVLRHYPETGKCGGYRQDGGLILQAEHLISRSKNLSFAEPKNIVCLCLRHHSYWKPQNSFLYWELIEKIVGAKRWKWLKRVEADRKSYQFGVYEFGKLELVLKQELEKLTNKRK